MAVTLEDFYIRVLRELEVVPPNGDALAEDRARVVEVYPNVYATLLDLGLVEWGLTDAIPDKFVIPLVKVVAYELTSVFSVPLEKVMKLKQEGELDAIPPSMAERKLRKRIAQEYISETLAQDYF